MGRSRARGFTIIELLVVASIIVLLLAILLPALGQSRRTVRAVRCASNQHQIAVAIANRRTDERSNAAGARLGTGSWPGDVFHPYLNRNRPIYICPDDDDPHNGKKLSLEGYIQVFSSDNGTYLGYDMPLGESSFTMKLSQTQYDQVAPSQGKRIDSPPSYVPDGNPRRWYFCFDDQVGQVDDNDYEDLIIRVDESDDQLTLYPKKGGAGYGFKIRLPGVNPPPPDTFITNSGFAPLTCGAIYSVYTSYGMNVNAKGPMDPGTILLLDYEKVEAAPAGAATGALDDWDAADWKNPTTGKTKFFRHPGFKAIVTLNDLSVGAKRLDRLVLDPENNAAIAARLWGKP